MIRFVTGDMFASELPALAHGCNCAGAMGAGIAIEFRTRWDTMYRVYQERCKKGRFRLGDVMLWTTPTQYIFNLGTQSTWRDKADLRAITEAVERMTIVATELQIPHIVMPRIGAGLGGLDWGPVRDRLIQVIDHAPVVVDVVETFQKGVVIPGLRLEPVPEYEE